MFEDMKSVAYNNVTEYISNNTQECVSSVLNAISNAYIDGFFNGAEYILDKANAEGEENDDVL